MNQIEDQLHFVFHCTLYNDNRDELYRKALMSIPMWDNLPDSDKLCKLFEELPRNLGKYIKKSYMLRRQTIFN